MDKNSMSYLYSFLIISAILLAVVQESLEYKHMLLESPLLCSPITKRKIKLGSGSSSALIVTQSLLNLHSIPWNVDTYCKFEVQSSYRRGGVIAVIQKLKLRRNSTSGQCIDFVQFRTKNHLLSPKYCDELDVTLGTSPEYISDFAPTFSDRDSFIDRNGEMNVEIFIARTPLLGSYQQMELLIAFTSYKDCSDNYDEDDNLQPCVTKAKQMCIHKDFFNDQIVNCPYEGCLDESGCNNEHMKADGNHNEKRMSIGNKVLLGSLSSLCILFAIFILCMWAFKQHKLFCWAPEYTRNSRNNTATERQQDVDPVTLGQSEPLSTTIHSVPSAPPPTDNRDLPPSYESLFPNSK